MSFEMSRSFRTDLPASPDPWSAPPKFSFVGGHNDAASVPFSGLGEALLTGLRDHGQDLAYYNLGGSPLGFTPLREFVIGDLGARAGIIGEADNVLMVSGSLQALDLVNHAMLSEGDTVIIERATYGGMVSRLQRLGVDYVGVELDDDGIVVEDLRRILDELAAAGTTPRYLYTIPTVQNPTGSVMPLERRRRLLEVAHEYGLPIFEDECYADLTWGCERPPSLRALDGDGGHVIYCGSFSKSIAPALRVGYLIADQPVIRQLLALKTDAGTGSLEQLALAHFCPTNFTEHVERLMRSLRSKADVMVDAVHTHFPDDVTVTNPLGGIYVWLTFPEGVDTDLLAAPARAAGIEFNPGSGWSADPEWGKRRLRLCFGAPSAATITDGVKALAAVYANHLESAQPSPSA